MSSIAPASHDVVVVTPNYHPAATLVARLLMAAIFLVFGMRKALAFAGTVGYFTKLGFPMPEVMVVLAILIEIGGGILLVIGLRTRWVAWLLALFVVIGTLMAHRYWEFEAAQYANQMSHFFKNLCIIGGLMMVACFGAGPLSIDKR
ncbi:MAG TPA: DoxX family protein [Burkholderiales bacterium]|nr:DoxX family protein [Burkholderiales bacterium]